MAAAGAIVAAGAVGAAVGGAALTWTMAAWVGGSALGVGSLSTISSYVTNLNNSDDHIGDAGWRISIEEISSRAIALHDGDLMTEPALLTGSGYRHVNWSIPSHHPAVDGSGYQFNGQIVSCAADTDCAADRRCELGACVPEAWINRTLPARFETLGGTRGTLENYRLTGSGADYRFYIATALSSEEALQ